jgi:hypothetical protein
MRPPRVTEPGTVVPGGEVPYALENSSGEQKGYPTREPPNRRVSSAPSRSPLMVAADLAAGDAGAIEEALEAAW